MTVNPTFCPGIYNLVVPGGSGEAAGYEAELSPIRAEEESSRVLVQHYWVIVSCTPLLVAPSHTFATSERCAWCGRGCLMSSLSSVIRVSYHHHLPGLLIDIEVTFSVIGCNNFNFIYPRSYSEIILLTPSLNHFVSMP